MAGHKFVPRTNDIASCIEALTQIAGTLEELASRLETASSAPDAQLEARVRRALEINLEKGDESCSVAELVGACMAELEIDGGVVVPAAVIRKLIPSLMEELFGARLSCSIRHGGKYARGFRGVKPRLHSVTASPADARAQVAPTDKDLGQPPAD